MVASNDELHIEWRDTTVTATLTRASKANALSATIVENLTDLVTQAEQSGITLLVIRGEGRHFCAGFDLGDLEGQSDGDLLLRLVRIEIMLQAVANARFVTLALAQGKIIGAGCDLFCACTLRVAERQAEFRMAGWRFGIALGTRRLVDKVGSDAARSVLLDSRKFDSAEAASIGLVTELAEQDRWPEITTIADQRSRALEPTARRTLLALTTADTRAADMASLVMSASAPGLRERIKAFRGMLLP